jgi:hypothetical protein
MGCNIYVNGSWQEPCHAWAGDTYCVAKSLSSGLSGTFWSSCTMHEGCSAQADLWSPDYNKPPYCPDIPDQIER